MGWWRVLAPQVASAGARDFLLRERAATGGGAACVDASDPADGDGDADEAGDDCCAAANGGCAVGAG